MKLLTTIQLCLFGNQSWNLMKHKLTGSTSGALTYRYVHVNMHFFILSSEFLNFEYLLRSACSFVPKDPQQLLP